MQKHAPANRLEIYKALILLGFCFMLSYFLFTQKIKLYINPRFTVLTVAADLVIFLLFLAQLSRVFNKSGIHGYCHHHSSSAWALIPFVIPILFVFIMPNATLDASIAADRGVNISSTNTPQAARESTANIPTSTPSDSTQNQSNSQQYTPPAHHDYSRDARLIVTDDNFVYLISQIYENPQKFAGKDISMLGFVIRENDFSPKQFGVVRYVITCCTADAMPCGLLCEYTDAASVKTGNWLIIEGVIEMIEMRNRSFAGVKIRSLEPVQEPKMPYVYPVY